MDEPVFRQKPLYDVRGEKLQCETKHFIIKHNSLFQDCLIVFAELIDSMHTHTEWVDNRKGLGALVM